MPRRADAMSIALATSGANDFSRLLSVESFRRITGRARLPFGKLAGPSPYSAASAEAVSEVTPRSRCTAITNGVRAYSVAFSVASSASSLAFGGRFETDRSSLPAVSALMPPLLPSAGNTSIRVPGWACMNASASNFMPPTALPVPLMRMVCSAWAVYASVSAIPNPNAMSPRKLHGLPESCDMFHLVEESRRGQCRPVGKSQSVEQPSFWCRL
jgi:hypothetical protein